MNRLRSPIVVDAAAAGRAAVDGDELAEDVAGADLEARRLAAVLQVLRRQADRGEREDLGAVADRGVAVDHRRRADLAVRGRCTTCGPIDGERRRRRCRRRPRASGATRAVRIDVARSASDRQHQLGLGHDLAVDFGEAADASRAAARRAERDLEPQPIAGHDLLAELGAVDAAQLHDVRRGDAARAASSSSSVAACASASIIRTAGISGLPGKVSLEELFVDGDVLDRDEPLPGSCSAIGVDEERGKAVRARRSRTRRRMPAFTDPGASSVPAGLAAAAWPSRAS